MVDEHILSLIAALTQTARRPEIARALAAQLGADDLIVFTRDAEIERLLPAPGFPQTLPGGRAWRAFLEHCVPAQYHTAELPSLDAATTTPALGLSGDDGTVLVLLGGAPLLAELGGIQMLLPLLAAALLSEQTARTAAAQAVMAREAAAQARALAEGLDAARGELQRELQTRDDFLASASHDLKNPLTTIRGGAQLLLRHLSREREVDRDRLLKGLAQMEATTSRMALQIDEVLEVTRLRMGRPLDLERQPTDLVSVARRVAAEYQQGTERHHIRIDTVEARIEGEWDAPRIERVMGNLLSNAIKYSPEGGDIVVTLARERDSAPSWAVVRVRDQGLGIAEGDIPSLFERFQRGRNVVGSIAGTGMGLAGARQVIEQHGGSIAVESVLGTGAAFTFRLPMAAGDAQADRAPPEDSSLTVHRPRAARRNLGDLSGGRDGTLRRASETDSHAAERPSGG